MIRGGWTWDEKLQAKEKTSGYGRQAAANSEQENSGLGPAFMPGEQAKKRHCGAAFTRLIIVA
jgi:hypothetical protein